LYQLSVDEQNKRMNILLSGKVNLEEAKKLSEEFKGKAFLFRGSKFTVLIDSSKALSISEESRRVLRDALAAADIFGMRKLALVANQPEEIIKLRQSAKARGKSEKEGYFIEKEQGEEFLSL